MNALDETLATLSAHAAAADAAAEWPATSWEALRRAGVLGWIIPREYGGQELAPAELLDGYAALAGACLTTAFLLSQRDAACRRLRDGDNAELRRALLPALARGESFATVGVSQLTTARQYGRPALVATPAGDGFRLDGVMPWVTGAARADHFVTGAATEDGRQLLLVVPRPAAGLRVGQPLALAALEGSLTAEVRCDGVELSRRWVLAGPAAQVMPPGRGAGGLETSALALGLAGAAVAYLMAEAERRPEWRPSAEAHAASHRRLRETLRRLAAGAPAEEGPRLRGRSNALALRATQLALAAGKGTAFLREHPVQRWARQALFLLVWSCPRAAVDATLPFLEPPAAG
jgi:alkylation response protein AidB-like acyl-CoA dehydrogenase